MKIQRIEVIQIETPRFYGYVSGHTLVKVHVDDGPVGLGEASDSKCADVPALAAALNDRLKGQDALPGCQETLYEPTRDQVRDIAEHLLIIAHRSTWK